jgi:sialic acid synthase
MEVAKELIGVAARYCKADVAKFQKRNNKELLSADEYNAPHPVPSNAYGPTYGLHREALELTIEQHEELKEHCFKERIGYATSVWDMTSAREIVELGSDLIKIPSAINLHFEMHEFLASHYEGQIHISTGMTTQAEMLSIIEFYEKQGRAKDVVFYACTSGYPVDFEDLCLLEISRLHSLFGSKVGAIGFSGHHLGIAADIAALTLGASWIERHFTLDRTWKGTDHAASLEPDGLRRLCRDVHNVVKALSHKPADILEVEKPQLIKLKATLKPASKVA